MVNDKSQRGLPPYVSYRTFWNFIDGLQQGIPARLDRSYWGEKFSGSTGTQLMSALRFLGLLDASDAPTSRLRQLVSAKGQQRTELLRQITSEAFVFLQEGSLDPKIATYAQLQEVFRDAFQSTDDVRRKCITFFVVLASDAGISLSPSITKRFRLRRTSTGTKTITRKTSVRTNRNPIIPQSLEEIPVQTPWDKMLLTKFPNFDPTWSDEFKLKWFVAFDELLKRGLSKNEKQ